MCRERFKYLRRKRMLGVTSSGYDRDHDYHRKGITSVGVDKLCDFSPYSDLCLCVVTWNMNGQVCYRDLEDMVARNNRKFDLLVIGLQEVPRKNISRRLQAALLDSHM